VVDPLTRLHAALAGRYTIERELGRGGMATVYLGHDPKHDRPVAIKVLRPELAASVGVERFLREIQIAAHLQHPHILALHDSGEADGILYYVMPFVEGESLRQKLERDGALPIGEAVRILSEVVDALAYAHAHGIVHRDIKPENVMLSGRHALVTDFGIAKAVTDAAAAPSLTTVGVALGTPAYMAPEQATADPKVNYRVDIYAAGVLAFELLTGHPPFTGDTPQMVLAAQVTATPPPLSRSGEAVPTPLTQVVMRCLAKRPEERWQTADELLTALEPFATPSGGVTAHGIGSALPNAVRRHPVAVFGGLAIVFLVAGARITMGLKRSAMLHWAREQAMPQIRQLADSGNWEAASDLAFRAQAFIPTDSLLNRLLRRVAGPVPIRSVPSGARVYRRPYTSSDTTWHYLGTTPLDSAWMPGAFPVAFYWYSRLKLEKPGYRTLEAILSSFPPPDTFFLDDGTTFPAGMVRVPGGDVDIGFPGLEQLKPISLKPYFIDRFEVTNRDFKRFVDSGGYARPELWDLPVGREGLALSWREAIASLTDKTGRPGPATWEAGDYPAGQADYPVTGVSWYEAMAYAKFVGKELPTIWHWSHAAGTEASGFIVPASNFAGKGPVRVGSLGGIGPYGTYDMAGNAREWCLNQTGAQHYILGGGWDDPTYAFNDAYAQPPFDRSATNGFRLAKYLSSDASLAAAKRPIEALFRDYSKEPPVPDKIYAIYRRLYDYDRTPLKAVVEEQDSSEDWVRQRITFAAAYGDERVIAYLFLPKRGHLPYQTVVYFPGSGGFHFRSSRTLVQPGQADFILKSGRAFLFPIYKSTFDRQDSLHSDIEDQTTFYRDHVIMWAKDLRRSVDYLETRPEIDAKKLAYLGQSWGGYLGGLMPAVEPRFRAVVLIVAGMDFQRPQPEVDPLNFLPHIKMPVLMLNGRYDHYFPVETSQRPMFRLLGTRPADKRQVIYDGGHFVPRPQLIKETLDWLDRYLGPVK